MLCCAMLPSNSYNTTQLPPDFVNCNLKNKTGCGPDHIYYIYKAVLMMISSVPPMTLTISLTLFQHILPVTRSMIILIFFWKKNSINRDMSASLEAGPSVSSHSFFVRNCLNLHFYTIIFQKSTQKW